MDKQEVINEIEKIDYQNLKYNSPERMLSEQKQLIIDIIDRLDEPQKVKVPAFVAKWISKCRELNWILPDLLAPEAFESNFARDTEEWLRQDKQNYDILARAWLDGYEVEEEPKWVVKIEDNGSAYFVDFFDELQPHLVYGLSGEVMRFDSEDKANAIVTLIECGTVEKV